MAGRKPKLTKEVQALLIDNISIGLSNEDACALVPIVTSSFYLWLQKGEQENAKPLYSEFLDAIKKAELNRKKVSLARIYQAGRGGQKVTERKTVSRITENGKTIIEETVVEREMPPDWKADAWYNERKYPNEFGRRYQVEVKEWRKQAELAGARPQEIENAFNKLVEEIAAGLPRGDVGRSDAKGV